MKKISFFICVMLFSILQAQITTVEEDISIDQMLSTIGLSGVTSNILYERAGMFANLVNFNNESDFNTSSKKHFIQAMLEMHNASNHMLFITNEELKNRIAETYQENQVDIGILNNTFQYLHFNEENPNLGGLLYHEATEKFSLIPNKQAYLSKQNTVIAATKEIVRGENVIFKIRNDMFFQEGSKTLKTLTANFGDGVWKTLINNSVLEEQNISITYQNSGEKTIVFNIVYSDDSTLTTRAKFKFKSIPSIISLSSDPCGLNDELKEDSYVISEYPFQGYDESFAFKGRSDYRIFYHTNNGMGIENKKIINPVILIDGFDPGDKRKIEPCDYDFYQEEEDFAFSDLTIYLDEDGEEIDFIEQLRLKGFDVIVVNNTNYCVNPSNTDMINTSYYDEENRRCINGWEYIDGGADYIERNGLNLVTLIEEINEELVTNDTPNSIAIVGPSMGGLISRYALSYMEKNNIPHNTRLWASIDSPHLGANIPLGTQALIYLLQGDSDEAKDFYNKQLGSTAAKQQLIEFHQESNSSNHVDTNFLNGRVANQGFDTDEGSLFYRTFFNNLTTNGLEGSNGYPQNLRKIALINGSLSGSKEAVLQNGQYLTSYGNNSENTLSVRGYNRICRIFCWDVHVASFRSYTLPNYNSTDKISRTRKGFSYKTERATNLNSRGNMDIVPGGYYNAYDELHNSLMGESYDSDETIIPYLDSGNVSLGFRFGYIGMGLFFGENYTKMRSRNNAIVHSFIPSFSAIAHTNPNQSWSNPLDYNLTCLSNKQTHFDSYYGESKNTNHTSFNYKSVAWLISELEGDELAPVFPISEDALTGPFNICLDTESTFYFDDICKTPSFVDSWEVTSNIEIISQTDYDLTVKGLSNGTGTITAIFSNGQSISRNVEIGIPPNLFSNSSISGEEYICGTNSYTYTLENANHPCVHTIDWSVSPNLNILSQNHNSITVAKNPFSNQHAGFITANIPNNSAQINKGVWVGVPNSNDLNIHKIGAYDFYVGTWTKLRAFHTTFMYPYNGSQNLAFEWQVPHSTTRSFDDTSYIDVRPNIGGQLNIGVRACNECGCSDWFYEMFTVGTDFNPQELTKLKP